MEAYRKVRSFLYFICRSNSNGLGLAMFGFRSTAIVIKGLRLYFMTKYQDSSLL
jgi:hypothetical protein